MNIIFKMDFPETVPVFLPSTIDEDASGPEPETFVKEFFSEVKVGGLFSRKTLSTNEASKYSEAHSNDPYLKDIPKNLIKDALLLQKAFLKLSGARDSKQFSGTYSDLVMLGLKDQALVDEGYAILLKQTNGSKGKIYVETMKLFALWGKYLRPSDAHAPYVLAHLARECKKTDTNSEMLDYAQFAYIRVSGRVRSHISLKPTPEQVNESINDISNPNICFNASLEEVMWHQRSAYPKLYVPYVMHRMANTFINMGCMTTEGIFRLPGNATRVDACPEKANKGEDFFHGLDVNDIATLIKKWFRTLEGNVVPEKFAKDNIYKKKIDDFVPVADKLPFLQKCTLMYLVGFLRKLAGAESVTSMSVANLAMTFAMSTAYISDDEAVNTSTYIQCFLMELIQKWDVSQIYPLPQSMIT